MSAGSYSHKGGWYKVHGVISRPTGLDPRNNFHSSPSSSSAKLDGASKTSSHRMTLLQLGA